MIKTVYIVFCFIAISFDLLIAGTPVGDGQTPQLKGNAHTELAAYSPMHAEALYLSMFESADAHSKLHFEAIKEIEASQGLKGDYSEYKNSGYLQYKCQGYSESLGGLIDATERMHPLLATKTPPKFAAAITNYNRVFGFVSHLSVSHIETVRGEFEDSKTFSQRTATLKGTLLKKIEAIEAELHIPRLPSQTFAVYGFPVKVGDYDIDRKQFSFIAITLLGQRQFGPGHRGFRLPTSGRLNKVKATFRFAGGGGDERHFSVPAVTVEPENAKKLAKVFRTKKALNAAFVLTHTLKDGENPYPDHNFNTLRVVLYDTTDGAIHLDITDTDPAPASESPAPEPPPQTKEDKESRTWTDRKGNKVTAALLSRKASTIELLAESGNVIRLNIRELSKRDQSHLSRLLRTKKASTPGGTRSKKP